LALEFSNKNVNDNDMELQLKTKTTAWLKYIINSWRLAVNDLQSETATSNKPPFMTTEVVLDKLDRYAPHILPDAQTYNMIIGAKIMQDPFKAPQFAELLLERMHQESSSNRRVKPNLVTYSMSLMLGQKVDFNILGRKQKLYCSK
jgi:hypothetical protein